MTSGQCCNEGVCSIDRSHFNSSKARANDRRNTRCVCHELVTALSFPLCGNAHLQENGTLSPDKAFFNHKSTAMSLAFCQQNPHSRVPGAGYPTSAGDADRVRIAHSHGMSDHKGAKPSAHAASAGCLHLAEMWMRFRLNHLTNVSHQRKNPNKTRRRRNWTAIPE
jgi:hypothetical protein